MSYDFSGQLFKEYLSDIAQKNLTTHCIYFMNIKIISMVNSYLYPPFDWEKMIENDQELYDGFKHAALK